MRKARRWANLVHVQMISCTCTIASVGLLLALDDKHEDGITAEDFGPLWVTLSLASFSQFWENAHHALAPFATIGIYMQIIYKMLRQAFAEFMARAAHTSRTLDKSPAKYLLPRRRPAGP